MQQVHHDTSFDALLPAAILFFPTLRASYAESTFENSFQMIYFSNYDVLVLFKNALYIVCKISVSGKEMKTANR